ncbi:unnamed protein product [Rotaria sp. Silwood2]|nr:unnamed protein product [Rotaria sp. Silwood2]
MSSSIPEIVDVVIVGAGPTGLLLACLLSIYGIKFRIIDKSVDHTTQSRALVVHARSLEILDQLGIGNEAVRRGEIAKSFSGFFHGKKRLEVNINILRTRNLTKYPYILILEQSKTEELFEDFLLKRNIQIDRQCELINFNEVCDNNNELIECTIKDYRDNIEGKLIKICTKYLCGCDGAHSKVRQNLKLSFPGNTYEETLFVIDCHVKFLDQSKSEKIINDVEFNLTKSGICLLFPLKDHENDNRYRVIGTIPHELLKSSKELKFEDIQLCISKHIERKIELYNSLWMSTYRTHHRYVESFSFNNKYFLLGDAAHIHSPVGGQGMNTGLQDAFNLAWKLAFTIQGKTINNNQLLKTYNDERIRVAKDLVNSTDRIFTFMTSSNYIIQFLRLNILPYIYQWIFSPLLNYISFLRDAFFKRISMIGIQYHHSELSITTEDLKKDKIQSGDRIPYVYTHSDNLLSLESTNNNNNNNNDDDDDDSRIYFHLHVLINPKRVNSNKLFLFVKFIQDYYSHLIKIHEFQYSEDTKEIFHAFGVNKNSEGAAFLIRPDQYIAYYTKTFDIQHFNTYFSKYFSQRRV